MSNVDVISDILSACVKAFPESNFVQSLAHQYLVRGWLSKKQMEGLYDKAKKLRDFSPGKLATLQAQIQKMPTRYKSSIPTETKPLFEEDAQTKKLLPDQSFVFYESGERIEETLKVIDQVLPYSKVVVCREMTKKFEEILRGTAHELKNHTYKGELTVVLG